jgi:PAS domain S-box-containing protein
VAEIERRRADEALRSTALAVTGRRGASVFAELAQLLATTLGVEVTFIARHRADDPQALTMLAMVHDGSVMQDRRYVIAGTPCETVFGQRFRAYPTRLGELFPEDADARVQGVVSYAGHPLNALDGTPLGVLAVASRHPLGQLRRVESMLGIFALRAAAEIERLNAEEALQESEASYRAIFESAEDAIFVHDWESGRILDVNPKACETYGHDREDLLRLSVADMSAGEAPYTLEDALGWIALAKQGRCPPFEWRRRNRDGSLHWDEVRLKPAQIGGRPHVLAFTRDITAHKAALSALRAQEQRYRAIFDGTVDSMVLWDRALRVVDVNDAFVQMTGLAREQVVGRHWSERPDAEDLPQLLALIEGALDGRIGQATLNVSRADGSRFDIELRYLPVRFGDETIALGVGRDVSARLDSERRLRDSEAQYRAIFNASADALVLRDADFRIVDVNATYERMSGWTHDEVLGLDRIVANPVEVAPSIRALHERALAGEPVRLEVPFVRRDGARYEIELRGVPILHRGAPHVLYIGRDITEHKRAELALRDSEAQYRAIFNASADALILWNSRFQRVDVNPAYERMYGWAREDVIGRGYDAQHFTEDYMRPRLELVRRALAGEACSAELESLRKGGERIQTENNAIPFVHRGEPHVLAITRDITERKTAAARLRDSEEQYRAIFNASTDALVLRDANYHAVEVNPAYTAVTGFARGEVLQSDRVLTQPDPSLQQRHREQHLGVLAGKPLKMEVRGARKDGSPLVLEVHGVPVTYRGQPHVLYAARDITEQREAEAQRAALERQLRQAQKMEAIGQLTGGIAHDFNNILTSVIGYLVMAEERAEAGGDAALQRQLGQAHLAAQRARDLIAQMLAFARRQRGERKVLALAPLLRQTLTLLRSTLPSSIEIDDGSLLRADDGPCVAADAVQLEQVVFNLCINARDAMRGGGRIGVRLQAHEHVRTTWHCASCRLPVADGSWVELAIVDDGAGIDPALLERIFDPFFSTKAPGHGSGMGLAMVHGIVHDHGGHVQVRTAPGAGAEFAVWLPLAPTPAADADRAPAAASPSGGTLRGRVLVVEDDAMVGVFMAERLALWGLEVTLQHDPLAALAWLEDPAQAVDLLLTDQTMPQLTGLQLARRVHAARPGLPVLLVSGNAQAFDAGELQASGIAGTLPKPVDAARLRTMLEELLAPAGR